MKKPAKKTKKRALITGITGQDGSYLTELLLNKGYEVHGIIRRASTFNTNRIDHLYKDPHIRGVNLFLHYGDLLDTSSVDKTIREVKPHELYHLGAQSHVRVSFDIPEYTANVDALGTLRVLEAVRSSRFHTKVYIAGSSEMFGSEPAPQSEETPFKPRSPYGYSKVFSYYAGRNYREAYGMFVAIGILFNHESPRRGETFVTRKITRGIAQIKKGEMEKIYLGNLDARRDWGYAPEYCEAMWLMMQHKTPDDFVIATGETHTVREFLDEAFKVADMGSYKDYVEIDERYYRPTEVDILRGDATKAQNKLRWKPRVTFKELVRIMVNADLEN